MIWTCSNLYGLFWTFQNSLDSSWNLMIIHKSSQSTLNNSQEHCCRKKRFWKRKTKRSIPGHKISSIWHKLVLERWLIDQLSQPPTCVHVHLYIVMGQPSPYPNLFLETQNKVVPVLISGNAITWNLAHPSSLYPFSLVIFSPCSHGIGPQITRLDISRGGWSFGGKRTKAK